MAWIALIIAGIFEIVWAVGIKYSQGFTRLWPSAITIGGMIVSIYYLSVALRTLPIGTAYTIWTGIGAVGTVIYGILILHEPVGAIRLLCISLIIASIIGLKLTSTQ